MYGNIKKLAVFFVSWLFAGPLLAQQPASNTRDFYMHTGRQLFWFDNALTAPGLRTAFINLLDSCGKLGLDKQKYKVDLLRKYNSLQKKDSLNITGVDALYTTTALRFCLDVYCGDMDGYVSYDEVSPKFADQDKAFVTSLLAGVKTPAALQAVIDSLQPPYAQYKDAKTALSQALAAGRVTDAKKYASQINHLRWLSHFRLKQFILVNIASGTLDLYRNDSAILTMRVVTGKASTKTPRFAAYCTDVVVYPYWNVPPSIALHELLPMFKKNAAVVDGLNIQVLDGNGRVVNHHNINWASYNSSNFPYHLRQSTGCDNALGVIKFNLTDPFNVYMHDTNNKLAFLLNSRYLSHGCIRLQKPEELANEILPAKLDSNLIASCLRDEKPTTLKLTEPVPVFVTYMIVNADTTAAQPFYKDIYNMFRQQK